MSLSRKAAKFDLFAKGVDRKALQDAVGFLGNLPAAKVDEAEDFILNAAWHCLQATEEENEAPTRPAFADNLRDTRKIAIKFSRKLNSIIGYVHPIALRYNLLNVASDEIKREALFYNFIEIQRRLPFLIDTLTAVEGELTKQGLDKGAGGSLNWRKSLDGTAKDELAVECHGIFESYRPGEAKSTEGGAFYNFYTAVYGIALSDEPEAKGVGAGYYVEEVCRVSRELAPTQVRISQIRRALKDPKLPKGKRRKLMEEQEENFLLLQAIKSRHPW